MTSPPATEEIDLTTVGIDIGSSTSHLMFARVRLRREPNVLSSRFIVVSRETLWQSPVVFTPYRQGNTIDERLLGQFIDRQYVDSGIGRDDVDSGAVILTGVALLRDNAHAITDLLAEGSGTFVCASAGHEMEARLAAHGSGAVARSRRSGSAVLNVDIGGGTTKFALVRDGQVVDTAAISVGGRLLSWDSMRRVERLETAGEAICQELDIEIGRGDRITPQAEAAIAAHMARAVVAMLDGPPFDDHLSRLLLLRPSAPRWDVDEVTFSGGVAEAVHDSGAVEHNDLGTALGAAIAGALARDGIPPVVAGGQKIRATVIGASQFSVQVSGDTVFVSEPGALPRRNVPVIRPLVAAADGDPGAISDAVRTVLRRRDPDGEGPACAVAIRWDAPPEYSRLRALAEGLASGLGARIARGDDVIVVTDGDIAQTLGRILHHELAVPTAVVCIDGLRLDDFDHIDIGERRGWPAAVPVVIKSLIFPSDAPTPEPVAAGTT